MAEADWIKTESPVWTTKDDSSGANVFGENALFCPSNSRTLMPVKTASVDITDIKVEAEFYITPPGTSATADIFLGMRVDTTPGATFGDGYYMGVFSIGGTSYLTIYKRVNGIMTQLAATTAFAFAVDTIHKIKAEAIGTALKVEFFTGVSLIKSVTDTDSTFTGDGSAGILRFRTASESNIALFMDNFKVFAA